MDINCDMGEWIDPTIGQRDKALMSCISSCNITCGAHAGNDHSIRQTMIWAKEHRVNIGAHPSYPDRLHFGRKSLKISEDALTKSLEEQLSHFKKMANSLSINITHVKPHGALYNDLAEQPQLLSLLHKIMIKIDLDIPIFILADSPSAQFAQDQNIKIRGEAFLDRAYANKTKLVSRSLENAVFGDMADWSKRYDSIKNSHGIYDIQNKFHPLRVDTLCVHSDSPNVLENLKGLLAIQGLDYGN